MAQAPLGGDHSPRGSGRSHWISKVLEVFGEALIGSTQVQTYNAPLACCGSLKIALMCLDVFGQSMVDASLKAVQTEVSLL